jgi:hypothetical protein
MWCGNSRGRPLIYCGSDGVTLMLLLVLRAGQHRGDNNMNTTHNTKTKLLASAVGGSSGRRPRRPAFLRDRCAIAAPEVSFARDTSAG